MNIEAVIIKHLENSTGVKTYAEIPTTKPNNFIVVEKIDGGMVNAINASTLIIYSYSTTLIDACELNEKVKVAILDALTIDDISSVRISGEDRGIDDSEKLYRYETTINLYHY